MLTQRLLCVVKRMLQLGSNKTLCGVEFAFACARICECVKARIWEIIVEFTSCKFHLNESNWQAHTHAQWKRIMCACMCVKMSTISIEHKTYMKHTVKTVSKFTPETRKR